MKLSEIKYLIETLRLDVPNYGRDSWVGGHFSRAADALEHLLQYVEWKPSSEAPEGDEPFLIRLDDGDRDHALNVAIARRLGQNWFFPTNQWPFEMASHFVPLPPPPNEPLVFSTHGVSK